MSNVLKRVCTTCWALSCAFSISGCNKKDDVKMEKWDGTISDVSEAIDGIVTIETAEELAGLAKKVNEGISYEGYTVKLAGDMDLDNREWTPIGYGSMHYDGTLDLEGAAFDGIFDGQNHTIYNLKISTFSKGGQGDVNAAGGIGLFGLNTGEIKNLSIDTADVSGNHYVGVLTGFNLNATITNCHVKNSKVNNIYDNEDDSGDKAGAIAGHFARGVLEGDAARLTNCSVENTVIKADRDAGQVVGCLSNGAIQLDNVAYEVIVSWNETGNVENKSNTNIKNDIVGRIA